MKRTLAKPLGTWFRAAGLVLAMFLMTGSVGCDTGPKNVDDDPTEEELDDLDISDDLGEDENGESEEADSGSGTRGDADSSSNQPNSSTSLDRQFAGGGSFASDAADTPDQPPSSASTVGVADEPVEASLTGPTN